MPKLEQFARPGLPAVRDVLRQVTELVQAQQTEEAGRSNEQQQQPRALDLRQEELQKPSPTQH